MPINGNKNHNNNFLFHMKRIFIEFLERPYFYNSAYSVRINAATLIVRQICNC